MAAALRQRNSATDADSVPAMTDKPAPATAKGSEKAPIWWSNAIFFTSVHVFALIALVTHPPHRTDPRNLLLCLLSWQAATFGITIGYHRLWSHRSFTATKGLRWALALMGCLGFQGSIRWWVLRHRIHHRWTDTEHDPYDSSRGLLFSHMGWIFRRPAYSKLPLVDRKDLDLDPVVRFQHRHYIPLTLTVGFLLPTLLSTLWYSDPFGGLLYGGIVARLLIWHFTFFINSLAHWCGEQEYARDISARGNLLLALFTGGEANHNYHHVFPRDFRNGPAQLDWDPSKWIIWTLHRCTPLVPKVFFAPETDVRAAREHVLLHGPSHSHHHPSHSDHSDGGGQTFFASLARTQGQKREGEEGSDGEGHGYDSGYGSAAAGRPHGDGSSEEEDFTTTPSGLAKKLPVWKRSDLHSHLSAFEQEPVEDSGRGRGRGRGKAVVLEIEGYAVDVTAFAASGEHPGGAALLHRFALRPEPSDQVEAAAEAEGGGSGKVEVKGREGKTEMDATEAFFGGLNGHQWPARRQMRSMRVAKIA